MASEKKDEISWLPDPEEHNYPAAESYLSLVYKPERAADMVARLKMAAIAQFKSKDIFRASQLSLLGISNARVEKDRKKVRAGVALSPILLVRDEVNGKVVIADGYHRLCAIYSIDEDAWIHCKII